MKLNKQEIAYLTKCGYPQYEIDLIEERIDHMVITSITSKGEKRISAVVAKRLLGSFATDADSFMSGVSRAAFHWSAMRNSTKYPNCRVYFDLSDWAMGRK